MFYHTCVDFDCKTTKLVALSEIGRNWSSLRLVDVQTFWSAGLFAGKRVIWSIIKLSETYPSVDQLPLNVFTNSNSKSKGKKFESLPFLTISSQFLDGSYMYMCTGVYLWENYCLVRTLVSQFQQFFRLFSSEWHRLLLLDENKINPRKRLWLPNATCKNIPIAHHFW